MSSDLDPRSALARIPGWDAAHVTIEPLDGGLTNRSYRVTRDGTACVLRLDAEFTRAWGLDRETELAVMRRAAAAGIAPGVRYADPTAGILLRDFVAARVWTPADLQEVAALEALAALLRRVHDLPAAGRRFDAARVAETYTAGLEPVPGFRAAARRCRALIASVPAPASFACCHNDVVAANVLACPGLKLIDWEYACDNDPLFDLACVIGYHELDDRLALRLVSAYAGTATRERLERLAELRRLYDALHWLWLANREIYRPNAAQRRRLEDLERRLGAGAA